MHVPARLSIYNKDMSAIARYVLSRIHWMLFSHAPTVLQFQSMSTYIFSVINFVLNSIFSSIILKSALMSTFPWLTDFIMNKDTDLLSKEDYRVWMESISCVSIDYL